MFAGEETLFCVEPGRKETRNSCVAYALHICTTRITGDMMTTGSVIRLRHRGGCCWAVGAGRRKLRASGFAWYRL